MKGIRSGAVLSACLLAWGYPASLPADECEQEQQAKLIAAAAAQEGLFRIPVAMSVSTAVVGEPGVLASGCCGINHVIFIS